MELACDGAKFLHKSSIIATKSEKTSQLIEAPGFWPVQDLFSLAGVSSNSPGGHDMAQVPGRFLEKIALFALQF